MTDRTLADVESDLERAATLETGAAVDLLERARRDLEELAGDPGVDQDHRRTLENRLEQRVRELRNRDAYDGGDFGAAMNPDEDDAP
ncbi:hypothetical protein HALLA_18335 [Halostagnicola larsenii XH-48]|uniref:Uncharacterized protein n=1 Tax=Halostagnicola larsenii XH-48 TaxID=797299 RepID=W0JT32_9EURY|nr:hypothetical protein [Halostagnicola larsenii]AHG00462.1 hypothetical protein HALLA_18335 [Halostagnicola larsenii XH-48]